MYIFQRCKQCNTVHYNKAIRKDCYKCDGGVLEVLPDSFLNDPNSVDKARAILANDVGFKNSFVERIKKILQSVQHRVNNGTKVIIEEVAKEILNSING